MSNPNDPNSIVRKLSEAVQVDSLYATGAMPIPRKPSLIRSTRAVIKWLWIANPSWCR